MKRGVLLGLGLVVLFAGLANFWIGNVVVGAAMIGIFVGLATASAIVTKRERDAAGRDKPRNVTEIDASSMI